MDSDPYGSELICRMSGSDPYFLQNTIKLKVDHKHIGAGKAYLFTKWFCLFGSNAGFYTETLRTATEFFFI